LRQWEYWTFEAILEPLHEFLFAVETPAETHRSVIELLVACLGSFRALLEQPKLQQDAHKYRVRTLSFKILAAMGPDALPLLPCVVGCCTREGSPDDDMQSAKAILMECGAKFLMAKFPTFDGDFVQDALLLFMGDVGRAEWQLSALVEGSLQNVSEELTTLFAEYVSRKEYEADMWQAEIRECYERDMHYDAVDVGDDCATTGTDEDVDYSCTDSWSSMTTEAIEYADRPVHTEPRQCPAIQLTAE